MTINYVKFFIISTFVLFISGCTRSVIETTSQRTLESFDRIKVTEVLNELIQLDIDTVYAYDQAIKAMKKKSFRDRLLEFKKVHERHVKVLSKAVLDLGGHPPGFSTDFKGFLTLGYTKVKASVGVRHALEAIETNEIISNRYYSKALQIPIPENVRAIIEQNRKDEEHHLEEIIKLEAVASKK